MRSRDLAVLIRPRVSPNTSRRENPTSYCCWWTNALCIAREVLHCRAGVWEMETVLRADVPGGKVFLRGYTVAGLVWGRG